MPKILMDMPEPPAGYEYTGNANPAYSYGGSGETNLFCATLRRIKPTTVMVELPREVATAYAAYKNESDTLTVFSEHHRVVGRACYSALAKEDA